MWFGVLGRLQARSGLGRPLAVPGPARRRLLAALLCRAGRTISAAHLVEDLWEAAPPPSAAKTLQSHIVRLRQDLARDGDRAVLLTEGDGYRLDLGPDDVDALSFERLLEEATRACEHGDRDAALRLLDAALSLWRDDAYLDVGDAPFAVSERMRLAELRSLARERRTDLVLELGRAEDLLPELEQRVRHEPYRERGWEQLMLALYAAGRQADALQTYGRVRSLLHRDLGIDPGHGLRGLEERILRQDAGLPLVRPDPVRAPTPARGNRCPYLGLAAYGEQEASLFVGRERLISVVIGRLARQSLVVVTGASGVGKSSMVRAGLIPALRRGALPGSSSWRMLTARPGRWPDEPPASPPDLLVIDQAEELFTELAGDQRADALDRLQQYRRGTGRLLLVLRSDFFGRLADVEQLADSVPQATVLVGPMREDELRRAVVEPAARLGLTLTADLVETVLEEVAGQPEPLPQLSQALVRTWENRSGNQLTVAAYRRGGGVTGALKAAAEECWDGLSEQGQRAARHLLTRLAVRSEGTWLRRALLPTELPGGGPAAEEALAALVAARLVLVGDRVEIAHDALLAHWPRLRGWLEERAASADMVSRLGHAALGWRSSGRHPSDLYRGPRLQAAVEWRDGHPEDLSPEEQDFLDASVSEAASELDRARAQLNRERQARGRLRLVAAGLACAVVVALAGVAVAVREQGAARGQAARASHAALTADARRVAALALSAPDIESAALLAVAGYRLEDTADSRNALLSVLERDNAALLRVRLPDRLLRLWPAPDGRRLFVLDDQRVVHVVDPASGSVVTSFPARAAWLDAATAGGLVVSGSTDGTPADRGRVTVLDARSGAVRVVLPVVSDGDGVPPVATGDGRRLAVVEAADAAATSAGSTLAIFDADRWAARPVRVVLSAPVDGLAASRDRIAVLTVDGRLSVLDAVTGRPVTTAVHRELGAPAVPYYALALSPDGTQLIVGTTPVRRYAVASLTGPGAPLSPTSEVTAVAYSPAGDRVALAAHNGAVEVYATATGRRTAGLPGHSGPALGAAWGATPTGPALFTAGLDSELIRWDLHALPRVIEQAAVATPQPATAERFGDTVVGVTPRQVGTTQAAERLYRLDLRTGQLRSWPLGLRDGDLVDQTVATTDGRLALVSVKPRRAASVLQLWDLTTGRHVRDLHLPAGADPSFIADGTFLADGKQAVVSTAPERLAVFAVGSGRLERQLSVRFRGDGAERLSVIPWQAAPSGRLLVAGADPGPPRPTGPLASGPVARSPNQRLALVDPSTGRMVAQTGIGPQPATAVGWSADRRLMAVGTSGGGLTVLDAATLARVTDAGTVHSGPVASVSFAPDGRTLVTGGSDALALWSLPSLLRLGSPLSLPPDELGSAGWWFAWFGSDGAIRGFAPRADQAGAAEESWFRMPGTARAWAAATCRLTLADMSRAQWRRYLGSRPYRPVCPH